MVVLTIVSSITFSRDMFGMNRLRDSRGTVSHHTANVLAEFVHSNSANSCQVDFLKNNNCQDFQYLKGLKKYVYLIQCLLIHFRQWIFQDHQSPYQLHL